MAIPALAVLFSSCGKDDPDNPELSARNYLRDNYFNVYYYWNDVVAEKNARISPMRYDSMDSYFHALLYSADRWSWMEDAASYVSSSTGTVTGGSYGVSFVQPVGDFGDYRVWVRYVYPGSPMETFGVTRGAQLTSVSDVDISDGFKTQDQIDRYNAAMKVSPQRFSFRLADGRDTSFTVAWKNPFTIDYVLRTEVFRPGDFYGLREPVGYLHYLSFNAYHIPALCRAMQTLKDAGVKKLILDLRYNGGGDARASDTLVSFIAPPASKGKPYVSRVHNSILREQGFDETFYIADNPGNLGLDGLYFIMGGGSASATEMVFNGVRPYMRGAVHHVGRTTYGKPNGMYVLMYPGGKSDYEAYGRNDYSRLQYAYYPIAFYNRNSSGELIPDSGFAPESTRGDDVYHDFGVEEGDIRACLYHIVNGTFPQESALQNVSGNETWRNGTMSGALLPEEKTNTFYGTYKVQLFK